MAKERHFSRLLIKADMSKSNIGESRWIVSEDADVEHPFEVFTTLGADLGSVWKGLWKLLGVSSFAQKSTRHSEVEGRGLPG
jgi:hypothetical protein